jgi:hypothetical protein
MIMVGSLVLAMGMFMAALGAGIARSDATSAVAS